MVTAEGEGKDEWLWDGEESKAGPWRIPPNTEGVRAGDRSQGGGGDQEGRCIDTAKCFLRPPRFNQALLRGQAGRWASLFPLGPSMPPATYDLHRQTWNRDLASNIRPATPPSADL